MSNNKIVDKLYKKILTLPGLRLIFSGLSNLKHLGIRQTWIKTKNFYSRSLESVNKKFHHYTEKQDINMQKATKFEKRVTVSILVPLYNTPIKFLHEMIKSVQNQTYDNWELLLADGSDKNGINIQKICSKYAKNDIRIVYKKLIANKGIAKNTNCCVEMATGKYFALLDHDDILHPSALFYIVKAINEQKADFIYTDEVIFVDRMIKSYIPHFKPDFAPDTLRSYNYICHFNVFSRELMDKVGLYRSECDGSQDYDMVLRLTEKAEKIVHIPKILYFWRSHKNSVASSISNKYYAIDSAKKALSDHLTRVGLKGEIKDSVTMSMYQISYKIIGNPLISIIIANKDQIKYLDRCLKSILSLSVYENYEIIIVENNSCDEKTFQYYESLKNNQKIKILYWKDSFNYSAINNFGAKQSSGEYLLLLNNDTQVISPNWLQELLMFSQRSDIGAVGSKLYYPDDTIQHAGVIIGIGGLSGHAHRFFKRNDSGYMDRLVLVQNLSAVTAACLMIRKSVFEEINGLDENYAVAFNDIDLCMRLRELGYLNIFTPFAELYHFESKTRGFDDTPEKIKRLGYEIERFKTRWNKELLTGDPYYNPNLTLEREDFKIE